MPEKRGHAHPSRPFEGAVGYGLASGPVPADRLQRAVCAAAGVAARGAQAADPQVAECEVEADGVVRIEGAQPRSDVLRRAPGEVLAPGEADEAADAV